MSFFNKILCQYQNEATGSGYGFVDVLLGRFREMVHLGSGLILPADYWQEEGTTNYFVEEETGLVITLTDL